MTLKSAIETWDGQSAAALCRIHDQHKDDPELAQALIELIGSLRYRMAATRLLKRHLESGGAVPDLAGVARSLFSKLDKIEHWECRLNILQCLPYLPFDDDSIAEVERFLRVCLADHNRFVRAWAYNGFHLLSRQHPRFSAEAGVILEAGLRDEPASIKARIRQCLAHADVREEQRGSVHE